jgi:hypothetical protein
MKPSTEKEKTLQERAEQLVKNANASEWLLLAAEEHQEKFELSNAAVRVVASMNWWHRLFKMKTLIKQYLIQLHEVDALYRRKEKELHKKMKKDFGVDLLEK